MNNLINQLSQIEQASDRILDGIAAKKKELTSLYEERAKQYDEKLRGETEVRLSDLRAKMEESMESQIKKQKADADMASKQLEDHYNASHADYVNRLFASMTEV